MLLKLLWFSYIVNLLNYHTQMLDLLINTGSPCKEVLGGINLRPFGTTTGMWLLPAALYGGLNPAGN